MSSEAPQSDQAPPRKRHLKLGYLAAVLIVSLCAALSLLIHAWQLTDANVVMIFLAGTILVAARYGHGPSVLASLLSVMTFDYLFVNPRFTFGPNDAQYFIMLGVMLGTGLFVSELTARLKAQLRDSRQKEHRTAQLYQMTRQLSTLTGADDFLVTAGQQLTRIFPGEVVLFLRGADDSLQLRLGEDTAIAKEPTNLATARWALENNRLAGLGTDIMPQASALFVPMAGSERTVGVLGIRPRDADCFQNAEQRGLLETCASVIALSIERDQSFADAQRAQMQVQSEQLRNSLLSSVSHDLRTPLAMIAVTASGLLEDSTEQNWAAKRDMLETVVDESHRLSRQVDNLLGMARLNSGTIVLNRDWEVLEELVGVAIRRLRLELSGHPVDVEIPQDFPLLWVAGELIEKVFVNLLENAIRYTPMGTKLEIKASRDGDRAKIQVADNGPGLPRGGEAKVFDKFFQGTAVVADGQRGIGLGLAICKSIVHAHGGQITAANRSQGGAEFTIQLPCPKQNPQLALDESSLSTN
jgi:two-component system sensor histidine kinase KdpD